MKNKRTKKSSADRKSQIRQLFWKGAKTLAVLNRKGFAHVIMFCAIFVPDFLLQAATRSEPSLRDKPLVLLDGPLPTFRVIAVSDTAQLWGVTPGLTKAAAAEFKGLQILLR